MITTSTPGEQLAQRIEQARRAQREWACQGVRQRLDFVDRFRLLLVENCDAVCAAVSKDMGKPAAEVLAGEVLPTADACRFLQREANNLLRPRHVSSRHRPLWLWGQTDTVHRRPRGVVAIIGTWNYPLFLNGVQILQALVAGNAVIWKPSEFVPGFAVLLGDLLWRAGFPRELVQVLAATRELGPLIAEADVDHVVFTGSDTVGKKLAARLGERLISSTLELSGCDAQLVLKDADAALAARAGWFGFTINRGQTCIAVRRAFVHRSLYSAYCESLHNWAANAAEMKLVSSGQVRQAERLVSEAVADGGRLLVESAGGGEEQCRPTVVVDARPEMSICREAAFAPVLAVIPFDTVEEALEMEARCPFALAASIFTRDTHSAERLAARLRSGSVTINDVVIPTAHPATPFGGSGSSGWGTTQGAEGLLEMTVPQTVSVRGGTFRPHYDSGDPDKLARQEELLRGLMQARHSARLGDRMRGWWRLIRAVWKGV